MEQRRFLDGRLKLRHLVLLTTIADEGTLVGAAAELHVTQPVVTRGLREVEAIVGVELFARGPRGVQPTAYGEILLDHARAALGNLRSAEARIDEFRRVGVPPVHVGTNLAGAYSLLPRALVKLKAAHPALTVTVIEAMPEELDNRLARGEVDVLVGRLQPKRATAATRHVPLYDEPVSIVVRRDHPASIAPARSIEELLDFPWILPARPTLLRDELDELFAKRGLSPPINVIECATILTLRSIVLQTDAIAPLPRLVGVEDDLLTTLPVALETVPRSIGITTLADRPPSPGARILIKFLIDVANEIAPHLTDPPVSRNPREAQTAREGHAV